MLHRPEETLPLSDFTMHATAVFDRVSETGRAVVIMHDGDAAAVIVEVGQYRQAQRELTLLRAVLAGEQDVRIGRIISHDDVEVRLHALLAD